MNSYTKNSSVIEIQKLTETIYGK